MIRSIFRDISESRSLLLGMFRYSKLFVGVFPIEDDSLISKLSIHFTVGSIDNAVIISGGTGE